MGSTFDFVKTRNREKREPVPGWAAGKIFVASAMPQIARAAAG